MNKVDKNRRRDKSWFFEKTNKAEEPLARWVGRNRNKPPTSGKKQIELQI